MDKAMSDNPTGSHDVRKSYTEKAGEKMHQHMKFQKPTGSEPTLSDVVEFLCGEAPLLGLWYGDTAPAEPPFWWRKYLRNAVTKVEAEQRAARLDELQRLNMAIEDRPKNNLFPSSPNGGDVQRYCESRTKELNGEELTYDVRMHLGWPAKLQASDKGAKS